MAGMYFRKFINIYSLQVETDAKNSNDQMSHYCRPLNFKAATIMRPNPVERCPMQLLLKRGAHVHEGFKIPNLFGRAHTPLLKCTMMFVYG